MEIIDIKELEAQKTFRRILNTLPHNRNRMYVKVSLENSKCKLYMPVRDNLVDKAKQAKLFYEDLANVAKL